MAHVLELEITREVEHVGGQVLLQRAEEQRTELQFQVLVALRLVTLVRAPPQRQLIVLYDAISVSVPISSDGRLGLFSSVHRAIQRHSFGE